MARTPRWLDGDSAVPTGAILLNVEATSLPAIVHILLDQLIYEGQMKPQDRDDVMRTLLLRHRYNQGQWFQGGSQGLGPSPACPAGAGLGGGKLCPSAPFGGTRAPTGLELSGGELVALGCLTPAPDVFSHPTEDESVWTMPPALVQRSGTTRADPERPLLREQRPVEMSRMAGKEQVSGDGGH